ncbi:DNZ54_00345 family protein [Leclercia adecarboxylata]|nr:DNZ54_00345 family protein [Leclercia adecarboxylata]MDK4747425.1 DNZ54_00345 family protein [Leclercia adecarboxylata]
MAALFYPRSSAPILVVAAVWVMSLLTWALTLCGVLGAIAGGSAKQSIKELLRKFFAAPDKPLLSWLMKILIVVCLAWSGWVIIRPARLTSRRAVRYFGIAGCAT